MLADLREKMPLERLEKIYFLNADNEDLRNTLEGLFPEAVKQTKNIAYRFQGGDAEASARNVHRFFRQNFLYVADSPDNQLIKLPSRLISDLHGDCKSFSLMSAAILFNLGYDTFFKYVQINNPHRATPNHVYTVISDENGKPIVVDGTCNLFNWEAPPFFFILKSLPTMKVTALADENLAMDAVREYVTRLQAMPQTERMIFINKLSPTSQRKLIAGIKSLDKLEELQKIETSVSENSPGVRIVYIPHWKKFSYAPKFANWIPYGTMQTNNIADIEAYGELNAENLAGRRGRRFLNFINKINPVLAVGRGAFLLIVKTGIGKLNDNLKKIIDSNQRDELKKKWEALGGKWSRLVDTVNSSHGIGNENLSEPISMEPVTIGAITTAASAVLGVLMPVIKKGLDKLGVPPEAINAMETGLKVGANYAQNENVQNALNTAASFVSNLNPDATSPDDITQAQQDVIEDNFQTFLPAIQQTAIQFTPAMELLQELQNRYGRGYLEELNPDEKSLVKRQYEYVSTEGKAPVSLTMKDLIQIAKDLNVKWKMEAEGKSKITFGSVGLALLALGGIAYAASKKN